MRLYQQRRQRYSRVINMIYIQILRGEVMINMIQNHTLWYSHDFRSRETPQWPSPNVIMKLEFSTITTSPVIVTLIFPEEDVSLSPSPVPKPLTCHTCRAAPLVSTRVSSATRCVVPAIKITRVPRTRNQMKQPSAKLYEFRSEMKEFPPIVEWPEADTRWN